MAKLAFINNRFVAATEAKVSVRDLALQRGYGVFDFFRLHHNKLLFLDDHLHRFYHSAEQMRLPVGYNIEELKGILKSLIEQNEMPGSGVRLTLTGGLSADGYSIAEPNLIITQSPVQLPTADAFEKGIKLVTYPHQRQLPHVKSIDYLMAIWLQPLLKDNKADDVLYHQNNLVSECPRSNIFIVTQEGTIKTPANNILKGITRNKIIQAAQPHFNVIEEDINTTDLEQAAEAFICSTTKLVLPVVQVNDTIFNSGKPGKITRQISQLFHQLL